MHWILIALLTTDAPLTMEFTSKEACTNALNRIEEMVLEPDAKGQLSQPLLLRSHRNTWAMCVQK